MQHNDKIASDLTHLPNGNPVTADTLAWAQRVVRKLEAEKRQHPNRSTTHEERYYHVDTDGTVFFRKEDDGVWYASVVIRDGRDPFVRSRGRTLARRKYFTQPHKRIALLPSQIPEYGTAEAIVDSAWAKRAQHVYRTEGSYF